MAPFIGFIESIAIAKFFGKMKSLCVCWCGCVCVHVSAFVKAFVLHGAVWSGHCSAMSSSLICILPAAQQHNYIINPTQELLALGTCVLMDDGDDVVWRWFVVVVVVMGGW